jgi:alkanesulfonate monooxygenase SsuD/methylene tetrahydromethanopterin reductase-like flavin-dependent oxidoreductase (luciferase family)
VKTGVFLFGGVEMDDAGAGQPDPTDRRYDAATTWKTTEHMLDMGVLADNLGYDSFWLTEHHFQYEGYEVIPNGLLIGAILAERTERVRIGSMFNIVGQWHPLRMAEDFATLHNLSGGRGILGIGRGTVPREAENLGTKIGSFDNPDAIAADEFNRKQFDEAIDVIIAALRNDRFSHTGDVYTFPTPGIPDRGGFVETLTLVPQPLHPFEVWQPITRPPTLEYVPKKGFNAVFWLRNHAYVKDWWDRYAELWAEHQGGVLSPGENRLLVLNTCVEDTKELAVTSVRPGHDEFWKFLAPYGWSRGYADANGQPVEAGRVPTLEDSIDNRTWVVGSPDDVIEGINFYKDSIGLDNLVIFPNMPGDTYAKTGEQMARMAEEVLPHI